MGYLPSSTDQRAAEAAWSLGHDWLGPEHFLLALVASPSVGRRCAARVRARLRTAEGGNRSLASALSRQPPTGL
ncbi:MAG: Clp protease N-terminal domain-containing protein [Solirubrobacterales bacterium]|nr:Clp protease N-terminal domain-containing protein [Solirubrobacterales bacterium]